MRATNSLALLAVAGLLVACAHELPEPAAMDDENLIGHGAEVYVQLCSQCHQPQGHGYGGVYPNLAGNPIVTLHDPFPVIDIVANGRGSMPSFRDELTLQERAAVISYIRNAWGHRASTVTPTQAR